MENEHYKTLWDFNKQYDQILDARRPDIVITHKDESEAKIIDVTVPGDWRVKCKETENNEKYQSLRDEIGKLWGMRKVMVIPLVTGVLVALKNIKNTGAAIRLEVIQNTTLWCTTRTLRRVQSL